MLHRGWRRMWHGLRSLPDDMRGFSLAKQSSNWYAARPNQSAKRARDWNLGGYQPGERFKKLARAAKRQTKHKTASVRSHYK